MTLQVKIIPVTPFQQNCALIWDSETKDAAVIDPGGDAATIAAAIAQEDVQVKDIFLTHGHLDHAGGAAELAGKFAVKITGPGEADDFLLRSIKIQADSFGFRAENCTPDAWLKEGDVITIAGVSFDVLHCPGHTPGHMVFVSRALNFGIFGDVLFRNSVGRTDFPYSDPAALITAIKTKLMVLPDDFTFICGHGPASTIGAERQSNPFIR
ncbi:MAG TPA: MBL fold metallo-hydrolase [Acidocella sp.]|jgi:hydroxyacylglutathione hydrolase|uniref:MBL fold metallo-hydrolase n=1 Tax=Acidocella sp. TaxID=50710 RepID=UPI002C718D8A|nr:MBL fold metallo-hydrolase [Acidocella sp.]HVE21609.1 MBL fold metallo-hydrolase [Acidocella sp.]